LTTTSLQKNLFLTSKEDITVSQIFKLIGARVLILPHLGWIRVYLMLGIHHTLVWNSVLQHIRRWWFQIVMWGLLGGRRHWRALRVHGCFHSFEIGNLEVVVSIISILAI
jgi:hypothetical protein